MYRYFVPVYVVLHLYEIPTYWYRYERRRVAIFGAGNAARLRPLLEGAVFFEDPRAGAAAREDIKGTYYPVPDEVLPWPAGLEREAILAAAPGLGAVATAIPPEFRQKHEVVFSVVHLAPGVVDGRFENEPSNKC